MQFIYSIRYNFKGFYVAFLGSMVPFHQMKMNTRNKMKEVMKMNARKEMKEVLLHDKFRENN